MPAPDAISVENLSRLVGTPRCPVILDVRSDTAQAADPRLLPAARRPPDNDLSSLERLVPDVTGRSVVVACAEGHARSQGTAAWLRHLGLAAEYLEGGQAAWTAAGLPLVDPGKITGRDDRGRSLWVTRSRPKIDRIACPWLIRRFIDPDAVFLLVAPGEVAAVAERWGAMPFDVEGAFWSHRGESCTFDVLLMEFGLSLPALDRLATIVRGADTARLDLASEAAGLLAASLGLSRMHPSDLEQLEAGMGLYDAFFRWARDATGETHNWPSAKAGAAP